MPPGRRHLAGDVVGFSARGDGTTVPPSPSSRPSTTGRSSIDETDDVLVVDAFFAPVRDADAMMEHDAGDSKLAHSSTRKHRNRRATARAAACSCSAIVASSTSEDDDERHDDDMHTAPKLCSVDVAWATNSHAASTPPLAASVVRKLFSASPAPGPDPDASTASCSPLSALCATRSASV